MKAAIEFFKNHYGKIFAGTSGTIIFTVAGIWFSDARYAHAGDVKKNNIEVRQAIEDLKAEIKELSKH